MVAAKKSKAVRQAEENLVLAELNAQTADAQKRQRFSEIKRALAWPTIVISILCGSGMVAILPKLIELAVNN